MTDNVICNVQVIVLILIADDITNFKEIFKHAKVFPNNGIILSPSIKAN